MVRSYINGLMLLVLSLAVISCSQDPIPEAEIREGRVYSFTIKQQTDKNVTENEGIRTLTLVFTGDGDRIVAVEEINPADFEVTATDPVLRGTVTLKVTEEATAVYAFANLDSKNLTNHADIQGALTEGGTFNKKAFAQIADINSLAVNETRAIPMSSHAYAIPATGGTKENPQEIGRPIVLYRMIAKVEVTLKNYTQEAVTINSLSLGNFQYRDIFLLPYEELKEGIDGTNKENVQPIFPNETSTPYSLPIVSTDKPITITAGMAMKDYKHYIHETDLGENNYITVSATIDGAEKTPVATEFSFVRRNDFLRIPLLLDKNKLVITLTESYAPIGGYPFENTLEGTEISVHEGSTIELTVGVENNEGESVSNNLTLTRKKGPLLLYNDQTVSGTYTAQIPAQPTNETSVYTLTGTLGGTAYERDLTFKVVNLGDAATQTTKSAPRSAGARLVLEEFYQLSCQTDE